MTTKAAQLLEALHWRYATKAFDPSRTIEPAAWDALEQALVLTASSYGLQPWKFLVITDPALRADLRPHAWNQSQITDCSHLVVLLSKRSIAAADADQLIAATAAARGLDPAALDGYRRMIQVDLIEGPRSQRIEDWAARQVYIALGTLLSGAALLGVDTCPIEGFSPADFDRILGLKDSDYRSCVVCANGNPNANNKNTTHAKVRYNTHAHI